MKATGLIPVILGFFLIGCSGGGGSAGTSSTTATNINGVVSAGPLNGGTVTAYTLNINGTQGNQLATTTSDSNGKFSLSMAVQSGPVIIIASAGSYVEEASGATIKMGNAQIRTLLPSLSTGQQVGVTPVTEIAAQNALAAISSNGSISLSSIINTSNKSIALAMGLTDITIPPANPNLSATLAISTQAAQYAVVLATISQMAQTAATTAGANINSLDIMQALATSFTYAGSFATTVGPSGSVQSVPVPNATGAILNLSTVLTDVGGSGATFSAAMQTAMSTYLTSQTASTLGFGNPALVSPPIFVTAPQLLGQSVLVIPTPPLTLPNTPPTTSGPPALLDLPPNPTNLVAAVVGTTINLSWQSAGGSTSGYYISYQIGSTAPANCLNGASTGGNNSFSISGLNYETQYSIRVCSANSNLNPSISTGVVVSTTIPIVPINQLWTVNCYPCSTGLWDLSQIVIPSSTVVNQQYSVTGTITNYWQGSAQSSDECVYQAQISGPLLTNTNPINNIGLTAIQNLIETPSTTSQFNNLLNNPTGPLGVITIQNLISGAGACATPGMTFYYALDSGGGFSIALAPPPPQTGTPIGTNISCNTATPITSMTIDNGSGGVNLNSNDSGSSIYFQLGDNPQVTWIYPSNGLSFIYDVTITGSQFIFNSFVSTSNYSACSYGPSTPLPPGISHSSPGCNSSNIVFTPFAANYSFSCVSNELVLELDLPVGPTYFFISP